MIESPAGAALARRLWVLYAVAAVTYLPVLRFYYVGEEAIFPLVSLEMWHRGEWLRQFLFGVDLQHNPLFNWIIIALCQLTGWEFMLAVARLVTITATVSTGLVLAWLAQRLSGDRVFAALAALIYMLFADIACYRGWLAYVDPLFSLLVFSALASLWVACRERSIRLLAVAIFALTAGFLTKALTAYVFYGATVLVLAWERDTRRFLLRPASLALHAAGAAFVAIWFGTLLGTEGHGQGARMFQEILEKLAPDNLLAYVVKVVAYPLETLAKLAPASLLAAYYGWKQRGTAQETPSALRTAAAIAVLNFVPYWLAPHSNTRYLLPIYPFVALTCAYLIWSARPASITVTVRWFYALLVVKLALALVAFPYYQKVYRGENHLHAARDILAFSAGETLYTYNFSATGLSVKAHIDLMRWPQLPLTFPPAKWENGFVIAYTVDPQLGQLAKQYRLGGGDLYLLCRGTACERR